MTAGKNRQMEPNYRDDIAGDPGVPGFTAGKKASELENCYAKRIESFEHCPPGCGGAANFLRIAAADLFRTMPYLEGDAIDELNDVFKNLSERKRPALRRYLHTLRVLRPSLETLSEIRGRPAR